MFDDLPTTGIDFELIPGRFVRGTVTDTGLVAIPGVDLDAFTLAGQYVEITALTDTNGDYRIGPFPPGDYIVRADPDSSLGFVRMWYDGAFQSEQATSITVTAATDVFG
ncbi:MAG: carboxypeptidase-like regulatory domain-containing protein, partial [Verrucomicrobiota bacterium]